MGWSFIFSNRFVTHGWLVSWFLICWIQKISAPLRDGTCSAHAIVGHRHFGQAVDRGDLLPAMERNHVEISPFILDIKKVINCSPTNNDDFPYHSVHIFVYLDQLKTP